MEYTQLVSGIIGACIVYYICLIGSCIRSVYLDIKNEKKGENEND